MRWLPLSKTAAASWFLLSGLGASGLMACGGPVQPKLPPPEYVEPRLPSWQPPRDTEQDSLEDALAGGEWAADGAQGLGGAPAEPLKPEDARTPAF